MIKINVVRTVSDPKGINTASVILSGNYGDGITVMLSKPMPLRLTRNLLVEELRRLGAELQLLRAEDIDGLSL